MHSKDLVAPLNTLNSELSALLILAYRLAEEVRSVLARIEPPAEGPELREAGRRYLATAPAAELRRALIEMRGPKAAANFRTRLSGELAQRHDRNGRAQANGSGATHAV